MSAVSEASHTRSSYYRYYVLLVLMIGQTLSVVDRGLISVVMTNIQNDFQLNDTQLGLLGGTAFALFYAAFGIPIARLADRTNTKNIFAAAVTVWSLATAACGAAPRPITNLSASNTMTFRSLAAIAKSVARQGAGNFSHKNCPLGKY